MMAAPVITPVPGMCPHTKKPISVDQIMMEYSNGATSPIGVMVKAWVRHKCPNTDKAPVKNTQPKTGNGMDTNSVIEKTVATKAAQTLK